MRRVSAVDFVRFVGMLAVVGFHMGEIYWGDGVMFPESWGQLGEIWRMLGWNPLYLVSVVGDQAVPLFLFLSGYLLVVRDQKPTWLWLKRRVLKVLVPFWIALLVMSPVVALMWRVAPDVFERTVIGSFSWDKVLWSGLLLQNWSEYTFNAPVSAWWFIPILVQCYGLYWILLRWLNEMNQDTFLLRLLKIQLVWNALMVLLVGLGYPFYWGYFSGVSYMFTFGLGMWWGRYGREVSGWAGLVVWGASWGLRLVFNRELQVVEGLLGWSWFLIWMAVGHWLEGRREILYRILSEIGRRWSYLVYLFHQPLLYVGFGLAYWYWGAWW